MTLSRRSFVAGAAGIAAAYPLRRVLTGMEGTAEAAVPLSLANVGWGLYNANGDINLGSDISYVQGVWGRKVDLCLGYQDWSNGYSAWPTPSAQVIYGIGGRSLEWTVQPQGGVNWQDLIYGYYDTQIINFANWVNANLAGTIFVRFAHEMNGSGWNAWQVGGACGVTSPANYAAGFNHVAAVLKAHSSKVLTVWGVNNGPTNNIAGYYPSACDVMGFSSYNFGPGPSPSTTWNDATYLNATAYQAVAACNPTKPIWLCEASCAEPSLPWYYNGGTCPVQPAVNKGTWVQRFLAETDMPRIAMIVWFDQPKERNWAIDSSSESSAAFYNGFSAVRNGGEYWNPATGGL